MGDGTRKDRNRPVRVGTRTHWASVEARADHTCATKTDGRLYCWGSNSQGMNGLGYRLDGTDVSQVSRPHLVAERVSSMALGLGWTCYVARSDLTCMGDNQSGVFGNGTRDPLYDSTQVNSGVSWRQLSTMDAHTCGIATDRTLRCWGDNVVGQIGDGTRRDRLSPVRVGTRADWASVSVGARHTCGLKTDGRVHCWGSNEHWQSGSSARGPFVEPRLVG